MQQKDFPKNSEEKIKDKKKHLWKPVNSSRRWEQKPQTSNWLWWTEALRTCWVTPTFGCMCSALGSGRSRALGLRGRTEIQLNDGCQRPPAHMCTISAAGTEGLDVLWQDTPKASERSQMPRIWVSRNEHHIKEVEEPINSDDMVRLSPRKTFP